MALIKGLQEQVAGLKAANEELQKQLVESQRGGKRQASPFSKGRRSSKPKRPGRKPGMGLFSYRKPHSADEVTEPVVEVAVSGEVCPRCGGRLEDEGVGVAYVTDISPVRRPQVTAYRVQICRCRSCGRQVRGRHPDIGSDQYGASAHRVGRRVMAAAHLLHYGMGVPVRIGPRCAQSADRGGSESGSDQPGRAATCHGCGGGDLPEAADFGACQSGRPHRRHWMAGGR